MVFRKNAGTNSQGMMPQREDSSLLSLAFIQLCLLALVAVCVAAGQTVLGMVLLAAALLGVLGRIWAFLTVQNLRVRLRASKTRMFPGDETVLSWQVKNEKFLPVLWLDVKQPLDAPVAMVPVDEEGNSLLRKMNRQDSLEYGLKEDAEAYLFQERCSLVGSWRTAAFETRWQAQKRGLYTLDRCRIHTGDGFGLTRYRMQLERDSHRHFVIYPRIVPVHADQFLKKLWEGESGGRGNLEDVSVIKLTRPYETGDSLKRMNWRMLARGQEMTVNQYEVISPRAVHFIFDGESWNSCPGGVQKIYRRSMEETLEILASLLLRLSERGMECGCSFPETDRLPAVNLFAVAGEQNGTVSQNSVTGEILYRMAEYEPKQPVLIKNPEGTGDVLAVQTSRFREEELTSSWMQVGQFYFVTRNEECAAESQLLRKMEGLPVEVLTFEKLKALKKGGADCGRKAGTSDNGI